MSARGGKEEAEGGEVGAMPEPRASQAHEIGALPSYLDALLLQALVFLEHLLLGRGAPRRWRGSCRERSIIFGLRTAHSSKARQGRS